jgi:hypothetical protein
MQERRVDRRAFITRRRSLRVKPRFFGAVGVSSVADRLPIAVMYL